MNNKRLQIALGLLTLLFTGCVSVSTSTEFAGFGAEGGAKNALTVEIVASGWFLFDLLPIVTANSAGEADFFKDNLCTQNNLEVLDEIIKRENIKHIGMIASHETDEGVLVFLINRHTFRTTATLLKD